MLKDQGKLDAAEEMMRRALAAEEKTLGRYHENTLITTWTLASVLKKQKKLDLAEDMMRRTLAGDEKTLGPDHGNTLITLLGLAELLNEQGRYEEASLLYKRGLPGAAKRSGEDSPWVVWHSEEYSDLLERVKATRDETQSSSP